jgi:DNA-binding NarL/FixJ family response regulator
MDSKLSWYGSLAIAEASKYRHQGKRGNLFRPRGELGQNDGSGQSSEGLGFKILIVEDNRSFREALSTSLQAHFPNLTLMKATRIQEAREKVRSIQPDLIFLDMRLPDGNGLDFTRSIRAEGNKSAIIILTSHDLPEYREAAFSGGADHFMVKGSIDINAIFAVVESILASRFGERRR